MKLLKKNCQSFTKDIFTKTFQSGVIDLNNDFKYGFHFPENARVFNGPGNYLYFNRDHSVYHYAEPGRESLITTSIYNKAKWRAEGKDILLEGIIDLYDTNHQPIKNEIPFQWIISIDDNGKVQIVEKYDNKENQYTYSCFSTSSISDN
jgi:hypothetical protein